MALDLTGVSTRSEALRVAYSYVNEDGNKLTPEEYNYLLGKFDIEPSDLDEVVYEGLEDEDLDAAAKDGTKEAKKDNIDDWGAAVSGAATTAGSVAAVIVGGLSGMSGAKGLLGKLGKFFKGGGSKSAGPILALMMSVAAAATHLATALSGKKEQMEQLNTQMQEGQEAMQATQDDMNDIAAQIIEAQTEAEVANAAGNDEIVKLTKEVFADEAAFQYYQAKIDKGETLTPEEKAEYDRMLAARTAFDEKVQGISDTIIENVQSSIGTVDGFQAAYDAHGETVLNLAETTAYTAKVAEATATTGKVNIIAAVANIASAVVAAVQMYFTHTWVGGLIGTAVAGGVATMEGFAIKHEKENVAAANTAIDSSAVTQTISDETFDMVVDEAEGSILISEGMTELEHNKTEEGHFS